MRQIRAPLSEQQRILQSLKSQVTAPGWSREELAADPRWERLYAASGPQSSILQKRIQSFLSSRPEDLSDQQITEFVNRLPEEVEAQKVLDRLAAWRMSFLQGALVDNQAVIAVGVLDDQERNLLAKRLRQTRQALESAEQQGRQEAIDQLQEDIADCQQEIIYAAEEERETWNWETIEAFCEALSYTLEREKGWPELEIEAVPRAIKYLTDQHFGQQQHHALTASLIASFEENERNHFQAVLGTSQA